MQMDQFLHQHKIPFEALVHPPAFSASRRASLLQVPGRLVAKCILVVSRSSRALAILPASHQLSLELLEDAMGEEPRLATREEIAEQIPDCEWGVVPPFGTLYDLPVLLDESIDSEEDIIFEGQGRMCSIRLRCADFERLENPRRFRFAFPQNSSWSRS